MASASFSSIFEPATDGSAPYVLIGVPFDRASSFRAGAHHGPRVIREMAESLNPCTERGVQLCHLNAVDHGDLALARDAGQAHRQIENAVAGILDGHAVPVVLGGDHSITVPCFQALLKRYPDVRLLYMDAHPDLYENFQGDRHSHACVAARVLEIEGMSGDRITQAGLRAWTPEQLETAAAHEIQTFSAWEMDRFAYETSKPVYLSLDMDVLDPAFAPGVGNPVPGGLSSRQLIDLIQRLDIEIVGMDLVEVNPLLDRSNATSVAAARLVLEALGVMADNR